LSPDYPRLSEEGKMPPCSWTPWEQTRPGGWLRSSHPLKIV